MRVLRADYGQDAPGVRLGMLGIGAAGLVLLVAGVMAGAYWHAVPGWLTRVVQTLGALGLVYGVGMGGYMTWGSRVGKLRTRDALLAEAGVMRAWRGDEAVLDVGCGRGLMMIGAAKRVPRGRVTGTDVWRDEDQGGNSPEAAWANARIEGVEDHVEVRTGDARALPFEDASFDVVMSHWVVHNLESEADQKKVVTEMWRVLRPGGLLVLADIAYVPRYKTELQALGAGECRMLDGGLEARVMGVLSGGSYRPQALLCLRPGERRVE